jgi:uncharacterized protein
LARIEVPEEAIAQVVAQRAAITKKLSELGYDYISVDLDGFISGRMNQTLSEEEKSTILAG